jgi:antitoxin CptB
MRELDAVLQQFLEREGGTLGTLDIERFGAVLDLPDPDLYAYIVGRREPADPAVAALIARIRATHRPRT